MRKVTKLIIWLLVIFVVLEFFFFVFKRYHEVSYDLKDGNYSVQEVYNKGTYYIKIFNKKESYSFDIDNIFSKRSKILKKVYTYKKDGLVCIYPKLKKNNELANIMCYKDGISYSYEYFKDNLNTFVQKLEKEGFHSPSWDKSSNKIDKIDTLSIYSNNIKDDTYIYIYKYDGFYFINNKLQLKKKLFNDDVYTNNLGVQCGKYYIIPNYNQKYDYNELLRIDMTNNKIKKIKLKKEISSDSYINGVIDNDIYLFDKDSLVQYKINPKKKKVSIVGNKDDGVLDYDLKFKTTDVYTMRDNNIRFKTLDHYINKIEDNSSFQFIVGNNDKYYYVLDNKVYYHNSFNKLNTLLFKMEISDFKLVNDTLYFISGDTIYSYDFINGLKKLVTYSELGFNFNNRIAIYME